MGILLLSFLLDLISSEFLNGQIVSDLRVNEILVNTSHFSARLGNDENGIITFVWNDLQQTRSNIFCRRSNSLGQFEGGSFRVNLIPDSSTSAEISVNEKGYFAICWIEANTGIINSSRIKLTLFNPDGSIINSQIIVNDTNGNFQHPISIGISQTREIVITWEQKNILYQIIDSIGNKVGRNKIVNDTINSIHSFPKVSIRRDGSFIVVWTDSRPPAQPNFEDVYIQMLDRNGNRIDNNQRVNDDPSSLNFHHYPQVSSDTSGNFTIAWNDNRLDNDYTEVYAQRYHETGMKNGINFRVTQSPLIYSKALSGISFRNNGSSIIYFTEFHNFIGTPYFQRLDSDGNFIGSNFAVTSQFPNSEKYGSDVKLFDNRIFSVWTDARNGLFDVYFNIRSFSNPDTTVGIQNSNSIVPTEFVLHQNFPNPFNSTCKIEFEIFVNDFYTLELTDLLGKKIYLVPKQFFQKGKYSIRLDSFNLSSGVYIYSLSSLKQKSSRKLVINK